MSQLFDSLRRDRQPQARTQNARTAHGDAVLATLGYAPVRRVGHRLSLARAAVIVAAIALAWTAWRVYYQPGSQVGARRTQQPPASSARRPGPSPRPPAIVPPAVTSGSAAPAVVPLPAAVPKAAAAPPPLVERVPARRPAASKGQTPAALPITHQDARATTAPPAVRAVPDDLALALYYHRAGDFENALQHYRALIEKNELNAQAHNNLGLLYQEKNLLPESARELQRAILIEPRNANAHNNYGVTLLMQGHPDQAAAEFEWVLALDRRNVDARVNLALAERNANQLDLAKETLLEALAVSPRSAAAHYNLAQLYDRTNEAARAIDHYRKFLENAGTEHADRAAAVRARIAELSRTPE